MKRINRLFGLLMIFLGFFTLASCSSDNIEVKMEYTASTSTITITSTFVETGIKAHIRQYSFDDDNNEVNDGVDKSLSFSESTTKAVTTFSNLDPDTKYLFKLYVTEASTDTLVTTLEARTKAKTDDDTPIEIKSISDFNLMNENPEGNYKLMENLDFTGSTFEYQFSQSAPFKGTFDGNGKSITNVTLPSNTYMGIFSYTKDAVIKNLKVENVEANVSQKAYIGSVIGYCEGTTVSDVTVKNVEITASGTKSYVVYIGGLVAHSKDSNFANVSVSEADLSFTRISREVKIGLFAGYIEGDSNKTVLIDNVETAYATKECSATGKITGLLWVSSSDTAANINIHVGGFVGHLESKSVIYDSYVEADIDLNQDTTSTTIPNFNLYAGGFVGLANGNAVIMGCFANADLAVSSGKAVTSETTVDEITALNEEALVKESGVTYIGGFAGALQRYIGMIINCYYKPKTADVTVNAYKYRVATSDEKSDFERECGDVDSVSLDTATTIDGLEYSITGSYYYTVEATKATVDSESFVTDTYYYLEDNNYVLATEFALETEYYTVNANKVEVKSQTEFDSGNYYNLNGTTYESTTTYKERVLNVKYLLQDELYAYLYETTATKLDNLTKFDNSDVSQYLAEFVLEYVQTIIQK